MKLRNIAAFFVLLLVLNACTFGVPIGERGRASVKVTPKSFTTSKSKQGNPSSYVVRGKRYYVMQDAKGFVQRGTASWYGPKFHGRKTSSGEVYNMHAMTAAHKTLPIPIYVRVKNLDNGRSSIVRVNDRGPFIDGRIIDLSFAAAKELGVDGPGTANVEISVIESGKKAERPVVRAIPLSNHDEQDVPLFIQTGSFSSRVNAYNLLQELIDANETSANIFRFNTSNGVFYRVRVGPLFDVEEASSVSRRLHKKGFKAARIVIEEEGE